MDTNLDQDLKELEEGIERLKRLKRKTDLAMAARNKEALEIADFANNKKGAGVDRQPFIDFFKKPYAVIPYGKNSVLIAVPKFVKGFQVGWLWKETESFYIYQFDQYSAWLGDAPKELLDSIGFEKGLDLIVAGNGITFAPDQREAVKRKLGHHLREIGDNHAVITRGHIFDVIAETIKNGCLPFKPTPVADEDRRPATHKFNLRPYQAAAHKKFLETGATGIFHPTGAGKSFIALHAIDTLKGEKVIIVPTRTLIEQWWHYIETHIPHAKNEVRIMTYQGFRGLAKPPKLMIFDECQRLPADTFSRLAVEPTKYRLGLSASPHREDGRENYIFALTGFPIGLNWQEYMTTVGKNYHPINVHIVKSASGKLRKLEELLDPKKKTLIFCDTIALGKDISRRFGVPYIFGETENRMAEIEQSRVVAISRVGDLGISVRDLQRIIEVDFLFGSRQQELQRTGRLMHSEDAERHDIIMTEVEMKQYGKRLYALQEKGFTIKIAS